jgi:hypothetical protein
VVEGGLHHTESTAQRADGLFATLSLLQSMDDLLLRRPACSHNGPPLDERTLTSNVAQFSGGITPCTTAPLAQAILRDKDFIVVHVKLSPAEADEGSPKAEPDLAWMEAAVEVGSRDE